MFASPDANWSKRKPRTTQPHTSNYSDPYQQPSNSTRSGSSNNGLTYNASGSAQARPSHRRIASDKDRLTPYAYTSSPPPPPTRGGYTSDSSRSAAGTPQPHRPSNTTRPSYDSDGGFVPKLGPGAWELRAKASDRGTAREGRKEDRSTARAASPVVTEPTKAETPEPIRDEAPLASSSSALVRTTTSTSTEVVRTKELSNEDMVAPAVTSRELAHSRKRRERSSSPLERSSSPSTETIAKEPRKTRDTPSPRELALSGKHRERSSSPSTEIVSKESRKTGDTPTSRELVLSGKRRERSASPSTEIISKESRKTGGTPPVASASTTRRHGSFDALLDHPPPTKQLVIEVPNSPRPLSPPHEPKLIPSPPPAPLFMPLYLPDQTPVIDVPIVMRAEKSREKRRERTTKSVKLIASVPEDTMVTDSPAEVLDFPRPAVNVWPKYLRLPESPLPDDQRFPSPANPPLDLTKDEEAILYQAPLPTTIPPAVSEITPATSVVTTTISTTAAPAVPSTPRLLPTTSIIRPRRGSNGSVSVTRPSRIRNDSIDDMVVPLIVSPSSVNEDPLQQSALPTSPVEEVAVAPTAASISPKLQEVRNTPERKGSGHEVVIKDVEEDPMSFFDLASPPPMKHHSFDMPPARTPIPPIEAAAPIARTTSSAERVYNTRRRSRSGSASAGHAHSVVPASETPPAEVTIPTASSSPTVAPPAPQPSTGTATRASPSPMLLPPPAIRRSSSRTGPMSATSASTAPEVSKPIIASAPVDSIPSEMRQIAAMTRSRNSTVPVADEVVVAAPSVNVATKPSNVIVPTTEPGVAMIHTGPASTPPTIRRSSRIVVATTSTPTQASAPAVAVVDPTPSIAPRSSEAAPAMISAPLAIIAADIVVAKASASDEPVRGPSPVTALAQVLASASALATRPTTTPALNTPPERRQPFLPDYSRHWAPKRSNSGDSLPPIHSVSDNVSKAVTQPPPAPPTVPPASATTISPALKSSETSVVVSKPASVLPELAPGLTETFDDWFLEMNDQIRTLVDMPDEALKSTQSHVVAESIVGRSKDTLPSHIASDEPKVNPPRSRTSSLFSRIPFRGLSSDDTRSIHAKEAEQSARQSIIHQLRSTDSLGRTAESTLSEMRTEKSSSEEEGETGSVIGRAIETPPPTLEPGIVSTNSSPAVHQGRHPIQDSGLINTRHESPTSIRERHVRRPSLLAERSFLDEIDSVVPSAIEETGHTATLKLNVEETARVRRTPSPIPPTEPEPRALPGREVQQSKAQRADRKQAGVTGKAPTSIPMSLRRPSMEKVITSAVSNALTSSSEESVALAAPVLHDAGVGRSNGKISGVTALPRSKADAPMQSPLTPAPPPEEAVQSSSVPPPKDLDLSSPAPVLKETPHPTAAGTRPRTRSAGREMPSQNSANVRHGILRTSASRQGAALRAAAQASGQEKSVSTTTGGRQRIETLTSKAALPVAPAVPAPPPVPSIATPTVIPNPSSSRKISEPSRPAAHAPLASTTSTPSEPQRRQRTTTAPSGPSRSKVPPPVPMPKAPSPVPPPKAPSPVPPQPPVQPRSESPASINSDYIEVAPAPDPVPAKARGGLFTFFKRHENPPKVSSRSGKSQGSQTPSPSASTDALEPPLIYRTTSKTKPPVPPVPPIPPIPPVPPIPSSARVPASPIPAERPSRHAETSRPPLPKSSSSRKAGTRKVAQPKEREKGLMSLFGSKTRAVRTSQASMEAVLGSSNNYLSPTPSTPMEIPPSPLPSRDPALAVYEWRNYDAANQKEGKRRHRPGVTWADLGSEPPGSPRAL
ncbi:hypothetical protein FRB94_010997 [Tulasnella sp. JGI-2019a]|nr:hypothetical protein FRB94_010997 [Tulasnella sp. JGI-2019a]